MKKIYLNENAACEVFSHLTGKSKLLKSVINETNEHLPSEQVEWITPITNNTVAHIECLWLLSEETGCTLTLDVSPDLSVRNQAFLEDIIQAKSLENASLTKRIINSFIEYFSFGIDSLRLIFNMGLSSLSTKASIKKTYSSVALIGVYGFEHVGDIGILGGVLLRINKQYDVKHVKLFSTQAEYTKRLAAELDTPVSLDVYPTKATAYRRELHDCDAVFWAGGPLMDLPRVLFRNLSVIYFMNRHGKPFFIEGIGVGPFKRSISLWAARQIVLKAKKINVRTRGAAASPILDNINVNIGRCPAFDYLETRQLKLTKLTQTDKESVDSLLRNTKGRILVGLNIRLIRHFYSSDNIDSSKSMENVFLDQLTEGLNLYSQKFNKPITFIFFPMNLIQVGMSDLGAAYSLRQQLDNKIDMRVWEADPDLDGVLYLLRQLDIAITMRFHACIFSMSQKIPCIGIDYESGGKVEQLFNDSGLDIDVRRMENIEASWLCSRLIHHSNSIDKQTYT